MSAVGRLDEYSDEMFRRHERTLDNFYFPAKIVEFEEAYLIIDHILYFYPTSRRCIFFDPIETSCFIYKSRPFSCEGYPFFFDDATQKLMILDRRCLGIGEGTFIDIDKQKDIIGRHKTCMIKDKKVLEEYVKRHELTHLADVSESKEKKPKTRVSLEKFLEEVDSKLRASYYERKPFGNRKLNLKKVLIDPFVELGIIPESLYCRPKYNFSKK